MTAVQKSKLQHLGWTHEMKEELSAADQPRVSSPVFSVPSGQNATTPENTKHEPENDNAEEPPSPTAPEPEVSPIKKLRELCRESKLKELQVLEFLIGIGSVDVTVTSFEQVALQSSASLKMLVRS